MLIKDVIGIIIILISLWNIIGIFVAINSDIRNVIENLKKGNKLRAWFLLFIFSI